MKQLYLGLADELIVDNFAGGGGASLGIEMAVRRSVDIAVNHDREAVAMHMANHPQTRHYCEDVFTVDPVKATGGRTVGLAWFSPDCTFHSKARGGKPFRDRNKARRRRGLAWVVIKWAKLVSPRIIMLENVEEFQDWGPLNDDGMPCKIRKGLTFRRWKKQLENIGYVVECQELRACDYGAPTIRKRLFVIARRDGLPIVWPKPTHGKGKGLKPYRTAADCIDWTLPCPSIFERERPLAEATMRRIAKGVKRYVIDSKEPFIVPFVQSFSFQYPEARKPMKVKTRKGDKMRWETSEEYWKRMETLPLPSGKTIFTPFLTEHANASNQRNFSAEEPLRTQCAQVKGGHFAVVAPTLIQTGYGERQGQAPRALDLHKPLGTVVAGGQKHALVAAFMAQHNTGMVGHPADKPVSTITGRGTQQQLVTSNLIKLYGTCKDGQDNRAPMPTITSGGQHIGEVRAFLLKYYGTDQDPQLRDPMHTVTTKQRFGLVTVKGEDYVIADIGMRMLQPRELYRAQGFPDSYVIDPMIDGKPMTKTAQVRMCGNSVSPVIAKALVEANLMDKEQQEPMVATA